MKSAFVIRHVMFEDLGTFAPILEQTGYRIRWHDAGVTDLPMDEAVKADLAIVLGGPIGVYDVQDYPFLTDEIAAVRQRLAADAATLGICLGSQIMAAALGSKVYAGENGKEIGWGPLQLTVDGQSNSLSEIGSSQTNVLHWHGDTFELPDGAKLLASTEQYRNQAFSIGRRGLALQFHPEVSASGLERWFVGHTLEISTTSGVSVKTLRAETAVHAPKLARSGPRFLSRWLDSIAAS
jgi:GMP synthase (glutamine-hydrolysing)